MNCAILRSLEKTTLPRHPFGLFGPENIFWTMLFIVSSFDKVMQGNKFFWIISEQSETSASRRGNRQTEVRECLISMDKHILLVADVDFVFGCLNNQWS